MMMMMMMMMNDKKQNRKNESRYVRKLYDDYNKYHLTTTKT